MGSKPADGEVTKVQISGKAVITAGRIGALGTYDETFTSVIVEEGSDVSGMLVQDQYRLAYDTGSEQQDTGSLPHTVRTETNSGTITVTPDKGIPSGITDTDSRFACWYVNVTQADSDSSTTTVRKALTNGTLPAGLKEKTTLNADTVSLAAAKDVTVNTDETKTLTVHAWLTPTGTVSGKKGRSFQMFSDGTSSVTTASDGCWTVQLTSTGTAIEGRDYQVQFASALPAGTMLTLTEPGSDAKAGTYYYYQVPDSGITSVKFTDFVRMGGKDHYQSVTEETVPEKETFLLAADFSGAKESDAVNNKVTFQLLPDAGSTEVMQLAEITYSLSSVTEGKVTADASTVSIEQMPVNAEQLTGKKLFLKAQITAEDTTAKIPFGITAQWNGKTGTWISRDTVLFETGSDNSTGTWQMDGLPNGTYTIMWSLVYGSSAEDNIAGNTISNEVPVPYTEQHTEPSLKVTPSEKNHILTAGTEHTIVCTYETTAAKVTVTVQRQTTFGQYESAGNGVLITEDSTDGKTAKITFGKDLPAGTYRICFSMDEDSQEGNVYITYIVKEAES